MDGIYECNQNGILSPTSHFGSRPASSQSQPTVSGESTKRSGKKRKLSDTAGELEVLKSVSCGLETMSAAFSNRRKMESTSEDIMGQFVATQLHLIKDNRVKQDVYMEIVRLLGEAIKKQ